jgi:hypothetical protein
VDFPPSLLHTPLAAVMFSPDVLTQLYGQSAALQQRVSGSESSAMTYRRCDRKTKGTDEAGKQRTPSQKLSIKRFGSFFRLEGRARSRIGDSDQLAVIQSINSDNEDMSETTEGGRQSVGFKSFIRANESASEYVGGDIGQQCEELPRA